MGKEDVWGFLRPSFLPPRSLSQRCHRRPKTKDFRQLFISFPREKKLQKEKNHVPKGGEHTKCLLGKKSVGTLTGVRLFLRRLLRNVFPTAGHLLFFRRRRSEKNKRNLGNRASIVQIHGLNTAK